MNQLNPLKRIQKELQAIEADPPPYCSVGPCGGKMYEWVAVVNGPPDTVYEGGNFFVKINFPSSYPFDPPTAIFLTRIYHCNVSYEGHIQLPILKEQWRSTMTVRDVLIALCRLMMECSPSSASLSRHIAEQYLMQRAEHDRTAREWTMRFAY